MVPGGAQAGGSNITPPIADSLEAMILDPWDPLVMWNDDALVPTYLVQIICPGITLTISPTLKNPQIRSDFDDPLSCCTMQLVYAGFRSGEVSPLESA